MGQELPVTSYALLGLLTFGDELTGYELKQRADITLRFYWTAPAMSQVYTELARLTEEQLVTPVSGAGRRSTRYRITPRGRRRLRTWMEATPAGFPVLKHPVALRLLIGHVLEPEGVARLLREYLDDLDRQRKDLTEVRESLRGRDTPGEVFRYPSLVADWGLAYYDAEEQITRDILARIEDEG
ncbi:MAG TPA: helix-turn-helix transcriptional regulator [Marmoricola sp.]|nr:helix-turn-helix transcriptional regulator [Marmoricola sp.]